MHDPLALIAARYLELVGPAFKVARAFAGDPRPIFWDPGRDLVARRPPSADFVLVKRGDAAFLAPHADGLAAAQAPLGGPHPLATAVVGGLLGSGLGYGGGYLAEKALGDRVRPGVLRRNLALAGGALGTIPGLTWGGVNLANPDDTGGGLKALTSPWPFVPPMPERLKASRFDARVFADADAAEAVKHAALADSGAFYMPTIPVDAFNNAVWSDVRPPNPYGTRSAWGTNEQPLGTPPAAAAAVSGLVAGAAAASGSPWVSPYHVALTAAVAGGKGYLAGALAGKMLGALAGLRPEAQATLRQVGAWGGLVSGVADSIFGG